MSESGRSSASSLQGGRALVACMMMIMGMPALDLAMVVLILPSVTLRDPQQESAGWILSAYLIALLATTPLWGALSDRYGRRRLLLLGTALFAAGAIGSAAGDGFALLVAARALQGAGAGSMQSLTQAIAGEHFSDYATRGKALAFLSASWGGAAVVAPAIAAVVPPERWHIVFLTTLPLAVVVLVLFPRVYRHPPPETSGRLDLAGCVLMVLLPLGIAVVAAGPPVPIAVTAVFVVAAAIVGLVFVERRASHPILPLAILRRSGLLAGLVSSVILGLTVVIVNVTAPMFGQLVLGEDAGTSGWVFAALSAAWTISALMTAPLLRRIGLRATGMLGAATVALGCLSFILLIVLHSGIWPHVVVGVVVGLGLGPFANSVVIGIQENVGAVHVGTASSLSMLSRSAGQTLGPALLAIALAVGSSWSSTAAGPTTIDDPQAVTVGSLLVFSLATVASIAAMLLIWRMVTHRGA